MERKKRKAIRRDRVSSESASTVGKDTGKGKTTKSKVRDEDASKKPASHKKEKSVSHKKEKTAPHKKEKSASQREEKSASHKKQHKTASQPLKEDKAKSASRQSASLSVASTSRTAEHRYHQCVLCGYMDRGSGNIKRHWKSHRGYIHDYEDDEVPRDRFYITIQDDETFFKQFPTDRPFPVRMSDLFDEGGHPRVTRMNLHWLRVTRPSPQKRKKTGRVIEPQSSSSSEAEQSDEEIGASRSSAEESSGSRPSDAVSRTGSSDSDQSDGADEEEQGSGSGSSSGSDAEGGQDPDDSDD